MLKNRSIATRMDKKTLTELKKLFPNRKPSEIIRILAEERIAVQRNTDNLFKARKALGGKKSNRDIL